MWRRTERLWGPIATARYLSRIDRFYLLTIVCRRTDAWHTWLYDRCREVERSPDGYLDLWAREHYKSTIITFAGIIQEIIRNPEITVGIFSHTAPRAKAFLAQIKRELEINEVLQLAYPEIFWADPRKQAPVWSLDSGIVVRRDSNTKESTIEAHGLVDGQPVGKHYSLLVYDDVVVPESVGTPEQLAKTTSAWELSDNLGTQHGRKWHIGTRYSYADTYEAMLKRGAVKARIYPATKDGTIDGEPVLFTQEVWARKVRDQGEATISCQMLQNPLAGHQRMFNVEDLQVYEVRPQTLMAYLMIDPARSMKRDSANTAMAVVGIDYAGNKYLLDGYDHKMKLQERWTRMRDLWIKWKQAPGIQGINVGYERYGAIADMDYFEERQKVEKVAFEIVPLEWPRDGLGSKEDRVQRLGPDFSAHRFYLPYETITTRLTTAQRKAQDSGYGYRIAKPIKRKDEDNNIYDLSERLKMQVHYFPFGGMKDLIDAVSRIYDMEPHAPVHIDSRTLEPEYT